MATITVCDRCRKELDRDKETWQVQVYGSKPDGHTAFSAGRELCIDCYTDTMNFIRAHLNHADSAK